MLKDWTIPRDVQFFNPCSDLKEASSTKSNNSNMLDALTSRMQRRAHKHNSIQYSWAQGHLLLESRVTNTTLSLTQTSESLSQPLPITSTQLIKIRSRPSTCQCAHVCCCPQWLEEGIRCLGAGVTGSCEPIDMGAWKES